LSISLEETSVGESSVSAVVRVTPPNLRVDERLASQALALHPTLAQHTCKQRGFGRFGDKLIGTTLPHLVEHLAIDLLVREDQEAHPPANSPHSPASFDPPRPRAGNTTWLDQKQGLMWIRLSHNDAGQGDGDAEVTCAAISRAVALVNTLLAQ
jgi:hypothetical protein